MNSPLFKHSAKYCTHCQKNSREQVHYQRGFNKGVHWQCKICGRKSVRCSK